MTLDALIMLVGTIVTITPFLGLPLGAERVILLVTGIMVIGLGIAVRRRKPDTLPEPQPHHHSSFVESAPHSHESTSETSGEHDAS
jgi:hypothetical protein